MRAQTLTVHGPRGQAVTVQADTLTERQAPVLVRATLADPGGATDGCQHLVVRYHRPTGTFLERVIGTPRWHTPAWCWHRSDLAGCLERCVWVDGYAYHRTQAPEVTVWADGSWCWGPAYPDRTNAVMVPAWRVDWLDRLRAAMGPGWSTCEDITAHHRAGLPETDLPDPARVAARFKAVAALARAVGDPDLLSGDVTDSEVEYLATDPDVLPTVRAAARRLLKETEQ